MNNEFVAASKPKAKRNKTGFNLHAPDSTLNSRVKNKKVLNFFSMLGLITSIKKIYQNIQKTMYSFRFRKIFVTN